MPSTSAKQHRFMQAVAHSPSFAKKTGVSQSVGKDFSAADKGKTFNKGGMMKKGKRFNGKDGESEVEYHEYDPDKTYSGRFTDDETGGLAENTPTRAYKPEKRETEDTPAPTAPARAAPARAASAPARTTAPAAAPAYRFRPITNDADAEKARAANMSSGTKDYISSAPTSRPVPTDADAEKARAANRSSGIKDYIPPKATAEEKQISNAAMAAIGAGATAAGVAVAAKLAGKKAGIIEKVIEKFTSKGSKTPEPQVIRSNRPSANARPEIKILSEQEKLAELASSAAKERAAGAATPRRFAYQTEKIQTPKRTLPDTIAERAAAAAERAPTGNNRFAYQTEKIQTPKRTLPDTIAERAAAAAERSKARGGRIVRMASGGSVSAASSRADGIAQRGKTKFRIY